MRDGIDDADFPASVEMKAHEVTEKTRWAKADKFIKEQRQADKLNKEKTKRKRREAEKRQIKRKRDEGDTTLRKKRIHLSNDLNQEVLYEISNKKKAGRSGVFLCERPRLCTDDDLRRVLRCF